jgi:hypothetical protein
MVESPRFADGDCSICKDVPRRDVRISATNIGRSGGTERRKRKKDPRRDTALNSVAMPGKSAPVTNLQRRRYQG